jgi:hypothetical protein
LLKNLALNPDNAPIFLPMLEELIIHLDWMKEHKKISLESLLSISVLMHPNTEEIQRYFERRRNALDLR